jgi:hypothetical protein
MRLQFLPIFLVVSTLTLLFHVEAMIIYFFGPLFMSALADNLFNMAKVGYVSMLGLLVAKGVSVNFFNDGEGLN